MFTKAAIENTNLNIGNSPTTAIGRTVMYAKLKGYTIDILEILHDTDGIFTPDIKGFIDKSTSFISVYLNRLKDYGLAFKGELDCWHLTATGKQLYIYIYNILSLKKKKKKKKTTRKQHENNTKITRTLDSQKRGPEIDVEQVKKEHGLAADEALVAGHLAAHYRKTGVPYKYYDNNYDIGDQLGIPGMEIDRCLKNLDHYNIVYLFQKGAFVKIGLKESLITYYSIGGK